jgi:hypothetical protein
MKKTLFSIAVLALLALNLNAAVLLTKADFSGVWKLDAAKSTGLPPGMEQTMTIAQTGDTIKFETLVKGTPQGDLTVADSYAADGKETDFKPANQPNGKGKRTAKWNADASGIEVTEKLEIETPEGGTVTVEATRKWSLAADGRTLTIEMKVKSPQGEQESKRIFVKQ